VYELLGPSADTELPPWVITFQAALAAYEARDLTEARAIFSRTNDSRAKGDGPSKFYLDYLAHGEILDTKVVALKEK